MEHTAESPKVRFSYKSVGDGVSLGLPPAFFFFDGDRLLGPQEVVRRLESVAEVEHRNVVLGRSSLTCPNCGGILRCPICGTDPGARLPKKGENDASDRL